MDLQVLGIFLFVFGAAADHQDRPTFIILESNENYETRQYKDSIWITTKIQDKSIFKITEANDNLNQYCAKIEESGNGTCSTTWPVVVTVTDEPHYFLSWFMVPHSDVSTFTHDSQVNVQLLPGGVVYVRTFGGTPSIDSGEENARILRESLKNDGKSFNPHVFHGAGYDPIISVTHHNEIWIYRP